jgi:ATP-dependent DNA helicase RecG
MVTNYPGPDSMIDMDKFRSGKAVAHRYRNRRIGDFLKEIDLSEKLSTGIKKILSSLKQNGSPAPLFETEPGRRYLSTTIFMHEEFEPIVIKKIEEVTTGVTTKVTTGVTTNLTDKEKAVLELLIENPYYSFPEMATRLSISRKSVAQRIKSMKEKDVIQRKGNNMSGYWVINQS